MATLKNHPGKWLRDDAAAQFDRAEAEHGVFAVNSAGRTEAEQQNLINRWNKGGAANRPPHLYEPAEPAATSNHVKNGGVAIDVADWRRFAVVCEEYGFKHTYPTGDPVHFDFVGLDQTDPRFDQNTFNRQMFLNSRGWDLVPDGREGPLTRKAYKEYQTFLRAWGYDGLIDGVWGPGTQAAHQKFWDHLHAPSAPAVTKYHTATVKDLATLGDTRGLQKLARYWGYKGTLDNKFYAGSQAALQSFLNKRYGGSVANWLRSRWGYEDLDDLWGPNMIAAATRANKANWQQLK